MKFKHYLSLALIVFTFGIDTVLIADDSVQTKAKDEFSDMKTNVSKGVRKSKKNVRKARGTNTATKDAKDKVNDVGDDLENSKEKLEHRVND